MRFLAFTFLFLSATLLISGCDSDSDSRPSSATSPASDPPPSNDGEEQLTKEQKTERLEAASLGFLGVLGTAALPKKANDLAKGEIACESGTVSVEESDSEAATFDQCSFIDDGENAYLHGIFTKKVISTSGSPFAPPFSGELEYSFDKLEYNDGKRSFIYTGIQNITLSSQDGVIVTLLSKNNGVLRIDSANEEFSIDDSELNVDIDNSTGSASIRIDGQGTMDIKDSSELPFQFATNEPLVSIAGLGLPTSGELEVSTGTSKLQIKIQDGAAIGEIDLDGDEVPEESGSFDF